MIGGYYTFNAPWEAFGGFANDLALKEDYFGGLFIHLPQKLFSES